MAMVAAFSALQRGDDGRRLWVYLGDGCCLLPMGWLMDGTTEFCVVAMTSFRVEKKCNILSKDCAMVSPSIESMLVEFHWQVFIVEYNSLLSIFYTRIT